MPQAFFSLEVLVLHGSVLLQNRSNKMHLPKNSSIRFPSLPMIIEKNGSHCIMARAKVMEKKSIDIQIEFLYHDQMLGFEVFCPFYQTLRGGYKSDTLSP